MDITTLALAKKSAKQYTDETIQGLGKGIVYKGAVDYYNDLPNNAELGDCYSVLYTGTSGEEPSNAEYVWGKKANATNPEWIKLGEDVPVVQYETIPTPTENNRGQIVQYIGETNEQYTNGYFYKNVYKAEIISELTEQAAIAGVNKFFVPATFTLDAAQTEQVWTDLRYDSNNFISVGYAETSGVDTISMSIFKTGAQTISINYVSANGIDYQIEEYYEEFTGYYTFDNKLTLEENWYPFAGKALLQVAPGYTWERIDIQPSEEVQVIQYATMPEMTPDKEGIIVQYTGETNKNYTKGYFYKGHYSTGPNAHTITYEEAEEGITMAFLYGELSMSFPLIDDTMYLPDDTETNYLKVQYINGTHVLIEAKINGIVWEYQYIYNSSNQTFTLTDNEGTLCGDTYLIFPKTISSSNLYGIYEYGAKEFIKIPTEEPAWMQLNTQPEMDLSGYCTKIENQNSFSWIMPYVGTQMSPIILDNYNVGDKLLVQADTTNPTYSYRSIYFKLNSTSNTTLEIPNVYYNTTFTILRKPDLTKDGMVLAIGEEFFLSQGSICSNIIRIFEHISNTSTGQLWYIRNQNKATSLNNISQTDYAQTITALKTFNILPQSSKAPTTNNQLTNKKYVDDAIAAIPGGQTIQYKTMPIATVQNSGQIVEYIGNTTRDYTKGYFYESALEQTPTSKLTQQIAENGINNIYLPETFTLSDGAPSSAIHVTLNSSPGLETSYLDIVSDETSGGYIIRVILNDSILGNKRFEWTSYDATHYTLDSYSENTDLGIQSMSSTVYLSTAWNNFANFIETMVGASSYKWKRVNTGAQYKKMPEAGPYTIGDIIQYIGPDILSTHNLTQQEANNGFDIFTLPKRVYFDSVPTIGDRVSFINDNIDLNINIVDASDKAGVYIAVDDYSSGINFNVLYNEDEDDPTHLTYWRSDDNPDDLIIALSENASLNSDWKSFAGPILQQQSNGDYKYKNGYFYIGVDTPNAKPRYTWEQQNVQPALNASNYYTKAEIDELLRNLSS